MPCCGYTYKPKLGDCLLFSIIICLAAITSIVCGVFLFEIPYNQQVQNWQQQPQVVLNTASFNVTKDGIFCVQTNFFTGIYIKSSEPVVYNIYSKWCLNGDISCELRHITAINQDISEQPLCFDQRNINNTLTTDCKVSDSKMGKAITLYVIGSVLLLFGSCLIYMHLQVNCKKVQESYNALN